MDLHTWAGNYHSSLILLANSPFSVMLPGSNVTRTALDCENKLEHLEKTQVSMSRSWKTAFKEDQSLNITRPLNSTNSKCYHFGIIGCTGNTEGEEIPPTVYYTLLSWFNTVSGYFGAHVSCAIWFCESSSRIWYSSAIMVLSMWKLRWHLASVNVSLSNF